MAKQLRQAGKQIGQCRAVRQVDLDFVSLPLVTHIEAAAETNFRCTDASLKQKLRCLLFHHLETGSESLPIEGGDQAGLGARQLESERADQQTERRHHAGAGGKYDARNFQLAGHAHGMRRAGAAECHHAGAAIIEAALRGMDAEGARHVFIDDLMHAPGGAINCHTERLGDACIYRGACRRDIELHIAAEEKIRIEIAEHQIGIGQRRLAAAFAVARRARIGAG